MSWRRSAASDAPMGAGHALCFQDSAASMRAALRESGRVYVNGDVAKRGQQAFRPGLTVRQALALAGGYDVMRFRAKDPFLESADLRSEYMSLWTDFAREQIRISRLQAELQGSDQLDLQGLVKTPVADSVISGLESIAREQQIARNEDHRKEKESLVAALKQQDDR